MNISNISVDSVSGFKIMGDVFKGSFGAIIFLILIFVLVWLLMKERIIK